MLRTRGVIRIRVHAEVRKLRDVIFERNINLVFIPVAGGRREKLAVARYKAFHRRDTSARHSENGKGITSSVIGGLLSKIKQGLNEPVALPPGPGRKVSRKLDVTMAELGPQCHRYPPQH